MAENFFERLRHHTAEHIKKHEPDIKGLAMKGLEIAAIIAVGALFNAFTSKGKKKGDEKS